MAADGCGSNHGSCGGAGSKMQTTPWYQLERLFNGRRQRRHPERASVRFGRQAVEGGKEAHHHLDLATVAAVWFFYLVTHTVTRPRGGRRGKIVRSYLQFGLRNLGRG